ncbi:S9 family peptidase [Flavobacterium salilacus subsp. salilacus]|uniref:S9 family peptidase n=1 Tax=Flavobacterium TaxID=237 RepID=UPI00107511FC|nr:MULTISPECIES: S9 family peptidase [Flavobacterium]KAF2519968.1 S9 family peptidase [Flavobacterium salilacus subsp. salilacus]MBE1614120.1 S9 family peptidase [Flavobacterium sp. SaA2.13]
MNNIQKVLFFFLLATLPVTAQQKITLEQIWGGAFRTNHMDELNAMKNSNQYTVLNINWNTGVAQIDLYDFATLEKVSTLIDSKNHTELKGIDSYTFSPDEQKILIATNSEQIFRHSFVADYFVYDIAAKTLVKVGDSKIQEPTFSADNSKIAYGYQNNLYVYDVATKAVTQITKDGKKNAIINGITDWVYEEEFAFVRAYDWNAAGDKIAFIRFDETEVPEFTMEYYNQGLYPAPYTFKYPKAGENNSKVSLHVYDVKANTTKKVNLNDFNAYYIPRIKWTNEAQTLSVQLINRHQNELNLVFVDADSGNAKGVLNEKDKAYIDITDNLTFLKDNSFIWTSEKDGYNHIYHYDSKGKLINQITKGNWEVTDYYGFDDKTGTIFYQSVENGSINRDVYRIGINGKNKTRLTPQTGTNEATFSPKFDYFINSFSNSTTPPTYSLHKTKDGKQVKEILDNKALADGLKTFSLPVKEFMEITTPKGHKLNAWMIKPTDFDPNKKYPVFMYQYSGPGSQQVNNDWNGYDDYWFMMLAQQGYIVACVDGRGTGFKGAEFKKVTYKELGKYEVEDQIDAAKEIGQYAYVDASRIGIFGWSYGGFMSSNCILKGNDVFKMAIAVAPVTNWRFYDSVYTERYMQTPQENASGYDENSPINHVKKLKGSYLLVHGSADDNVHLQNTMLMVEALVQANKQFDWAIYPDKNHGIYGGATRLQLYTKMTNFIKEKL